MQAEEVTVYHVIGNTDGNEGRGSDVWLGTFLNSASAATWARGKGVMGSSASVRPEPALVVSINGRPFTIGRRVYLSVEEAEGVAIEAARAAALAKLTPAERALLGLA